MAPMPFDLVSSVVTSDTYACATAIFGGMTPAVCTYLIHATDNRAMPGAWLTIPALLALVSALTARVQMRAEPAVAGAPA